MATNNTTNVIETALAPTNPGVTLPASIVELTPEMLNAIGITGTVKAARARANLKKSGVEIDVNDNVAVLADAVNSSIGKAESAFRNAGLALGVIAHYKVWVNQTAPNGKVYGEKGQKRFFRDLFPAYSEKTLIAYSRAGEEIYLPIKSGDESFNGLEKLAELPPSVLKEITTIAGTEEGKAAIKKALTDAGDKPLTQRQLAAVRHEVKKDETKKPESDVTPGMGASEEQIAEQLKGGAVKAKFAKCFTPYVDDNTGEFQITVIGAAQNSESGEWLKAAANDADKALELVKLMYAAYVKAMPSKAE